MSKRKLFLLSKKASFLEEALKNESVKTDSDFELNEIHGSADQYPEFGNNTHTEPFHSNTGHLKDIDIASSSSEMINDLVDFTDLPDAFLSFSFIGSSEEREQLTKEIDLAYQESLKADKLKTVTSKEENHNAINFDPDVDVTKKSNTNNNDEATRIRNARCKRVLPEPSASEEQFIVSVRHPTLGILRRSFTQQATVSALYDWVGSLNDYPIYFKLVYLPTELKPTERLASCRNSALNVSECIDPVRFEEEEEVTSA